MDNRGLCRTEHLRISLGMPPERARSRIGRAPLNVIAGRDSTVEKAVRQQGQPRLELHFALACSPVAIVFAWRPGEGSRQSACPFAPIATRSSAFPGDLSWPNFLEQVIHPAPPHVRSVPKRSYRTSPARPPILSNTTYAERPGTSRHPADHKSQSQAPREADPEGLRLVNTPHLRVN